MKKIRIISIALVVAVLSLMMGSAALAYPLTPSGVYCSFTGARTATVTAKFNSCTFTTVKHSIIARGGEGIAEGEGIGFNATAYLVAPKAVSSVEVSAIGSCMCGYNGHSYIVTFYR